MGTFRREAQKAKIFLQPLRPYRKLFVDKKIAEQKRLWHELNYSDTLDEEWGVFISELRELGIIK